MNNIYDLLQNALQIAKKSGANAASITAVSNTTSTIIRRKQKIDTLTDANSLSLFINLYVDGKFSTHTTNDLRPDALPSFIEKAVHLTRLLEPDPFRTLTPKDRYPQKTPLNLEIFDPSFDSISPEKRLEIATNLEDAALQVQGPIIEVSASLSTAKQEILVMNSEGLETEEKRTSFLASIRASVQDPNGKKPYDGQYIFTRYLADLKNLDTFAKEAVQRALNCIGQRKLPSQKTQLVLENQIAANFLSRYLAPLAGYNIQQKSSYFDEKLNTSVAAKNLTLTDAPHLKRGLASCSFDDEAMNTQERPIIENGILKNYYLDTYYANKLQMSPTTGSMSNLVVQTGDKSKQQIIQNIQKGIFVTNILGGNTDNTRGDFSHGIAGFAIENGTLTHPISEMNISGNHTELWNKLQEIGNDPFLYSKILSPTLHFSDISLSGQ